MRFRPIRKWATAMVVVLVMATCGGDDDVTASDDGPTTSTSTNASAGGAAGRKSGGGDFCRALRDQQVTLGEVIPAFVAGRPDAALLNRLEAENEAIVDLVPDDLASDMRQILSLTEAIIAGFRSGSISQGLPPEAATLLASPEFTAASTRVLNHMTDVCKIDISELAPQG